MEMELAEAIIQGATLSWSAKELLRYLLSISKHLDVHHLITTIKEGISATYRIVNELKSAGYIRTYTVRDKGRVVKSRYTLYAASAQIQIKVYYLILHLIMEIRYTFFKGANHH